MTRSMLVNSWRLLPGGEIKTQGVTQHAQSTHRGTSKMRVSGNRRQNRAGGLFSVALDRQVESHLGSGEEVDGNGLSQSVQPLELPANSFYLMHGAT